MKTSIKSIFGSGVAVGLLWLLALGTANAITVRGHVDPAFQASGTLGLLDWTADIVFDVGAECIAPNFNGVCTSVSNYSIAATLEFSGETLDLDFSQTAVPISLMVDGSGTVIGIDTPSGPPPAIGPSALWSFSSPRTGSGYAWLDFNFPTGDLPSSADLFLQFCTEVGILSVEDALTVSTLSSINTSNWWCESEDQCNPDFFSQDTQKSGVFAGVDISVSVPEPGILLLLLTALTAGLFARRKLS